VTPERRKRIQIILLAAIVLAAGRSAYILYRRHAERAEEAKSQARPLNADYYVMPKKLHAYDLKSANELTQQPVWVKEGYRYTYYAFDRRKHRSDFSHETGLLLPIERLEIKDVVTDISPGSHDQRQVMAVFEKDGKSYAFPIGSVKDGNYQIYSDEMLFIQDPHELYKHWPADVWQSIEKHEVKAGMNEIQTDFAIGMGIPQRSDDPSVKTVQYPNGGNPLTITYRNGKAAEIKAGSSAATDHFKIGEFSLAGPCSST
jgi:hypothetical protein